MAVRSHMNYLIMCLIIYYINACANDKNKTSNYNGCLIPINSTCDNLVTRYLNIEFYIISQRPAKPPRMITITEEK